MNFRIYGHFEVPRRNGLVSPDKNDLKEFWQSVETEEPGLQDACGCYIFALAAGGTTRPWYIGKTEKRDFRHECFQDHKLVHWQKILAARERGKPLLYLLPKVTQKGKFADSTIRYYKDIEFLERYLIYIAFFRNPDLTNDNHTKHLRRLSLPGILNSPPGRGSYGKAARDLKVVLGLD